MVGLFSHRPFQPMALIAVGSLFGAELLASAKSPPKIVQCSSPTFEVSVGDRIVLQIQTKDVAFATYWLHDETIRCLEEACEFPTTDWGVGRHQIYAVAQNDSGRTITEFTAKVFKPAFGKAPERVVFEPTAVDCKTIEVRHIDMTAQVRRGIGFIDGSEESIMLNRLPRSLKWNETLRAPDLTVVRLGNWQSDEHFVLPNGTATLSNNGSFRFIELVEGTVRSRQLGEDSPNWGVLIGKWAQISGDAEADLIVRKVKDEDAAYINVVRGVARVVLIKGKSQRIEVQAPEVVLVPAGGQIFVQNGKPHSKILALDSKRVSQAIRASTPFYTDPEMFGQVIKFMNSEERIPQSLAAKSKKKNPVHQRVDIEPWILSAEAFNQDEKTARELAKQLIDAYDPILALETLLPHVSGLTKDFEGTLLLARAYRKVGDHKLAIRYYLEALKFNAQNPDAQFEYGEIMMLERNWKDAFEAFRKARNRGFADRQLNLLNMGISEYFLDNTYYSKNSLLASIANGTSEPAKAVAQQYLDFIEEKKTFYLTMEVGGIYDSNIFQVPKSRDAVGGIDILQAYGYEYSGNIRYKAFKSELASVNLESELHSKSFLDAALEAVSRTTTDTKIEVRTEIYNWEGTNHWAYLGLTPRFRTISFGDARSADVYSYQLEFGPVMPFITPFVTYGSETWTDPFPARDDILDPDTEEIVLTSDRSQKAAEWSVGAWFERKDEHRTRIHFKQRQARHSSAAVVMDDYDRSSLRLHHWQRRTQLWAFGGDLLYWRNLFPRSEDQRSDTGFGLQGEFRFYLTNSLFFGTRAMYRQQTSSRDQSSYRRIELSGLLSLQL
jgi:tetratricopeptide (TPR) repeat protein